MHISTPLKLVRTTNNGMSKVSLDIVDQSLSPYRWGFVEPVARPCPRLLALHLNRSFSSSLTFFARNDGAGVESQPAPEPGLPASLVVVLTGFNLLNIISLVVFGVWKVLLTGNERGISMSRVELSLLMVSGLMYANFFFFHFRDWSWGRGGGL